MTMTTMIGNMASSSSKRQRRQSYIDQSWIASPLLLVLLLLLLASRNNNALAFLSVSLSSSHRNKALFSTLNDSKLPQAKTNTTSSSSLPSPLFSASTIPGPPSSTKPDYEQIHGPLGAWMDTLFLVVFRRALAQHTDGPDSTRPWTDFRGITELAARLNQQHKTNQTHIHWAARQTLLSLFPSWMPSQYAKLFSKPFPGFAARMNAWATYVAGTWLMGPCQVNDIILVDPATGDEMIGRRQGLLVERCRFLEESQCASVCVNSCKIPTQEFFLHDMGLPLTMEPNYETFECQFSFGKLPTVETELLATSTPCLQACPAMGGLRQMHEDREKARRQQGQQERRQSQQEDDDECDAGDSTSSRITAATPTPCSMMNDPSSE